jgi:hypothetical protein
MAAEMVSEDHFFRDLFRDAPVTEIVTDIRSKRRKRGRPPLGRKAMTAAERQARRRQRTARTVATCGRGRELDQGRETVGATPMKKQKANRVPTNSNLLQDALRRCHADPNFRTRFVMECRKQRQKPARSSGQR